MIRAATLSWIVLVVASLATGVLIEGQSGLRASAALPLILLIAAFKIRVIVQHYMELKHAPLAWRIAFELWPVVAASSIVGIWFFTGTAEHCSALGSASLLTASAENRC